MMKYGWFVTQQQNVLLNSHHHVILISICSIAGFEVDYAGTAMNFNADTHIKMFSTTLSNLKIDDMTDFAIAQTCDSMALNPKIACV